MRVTGVSYAEDHTAVTLTVDSKYAGGILLNEHGAMQMRDDLGNVYNLTPPPQNPDVTVLPGASLSGAFIFAGRLPREATMLTLLTNEQHGGNSEAVRRPQFRIDIPVRR